MNEILITDSELSSQDWKNQVIIRHLSYDDLPELEWNGEYKHLRQVYLKAYKSRNEGKSVIWIADLPGDGVIGQVFIQLNAIRKDLADGFNCAYLYSFRIKSPFRNKGLGKRMLDVVEEDLKKRRFRELTLNVAKTNADAIRFYLRSGFEILESEPGVWSYRDHNDNLQREVEPAWKMLKKL